MDTGGTTATGNVVRGVMNGSGNLHHNPEEDDDDAESTAALRAHQHHAQAEATTAVDSGSNNGYYGHDAPPPPPPSVAASTTTTNQQQQQQPSQSLLRQTTEPKPSQQGFSVEGGSELFLAVGGGSDDAGGGGGQQHQQQHGFVVDGGGGGGGGGNDEQQQQQQQQQEEVDAADIASWKVLAGESDVDDHNDVNGDHRHPGINTTVETNTSNEELARTLLFLSQSPPGKIMKRSTTYDDHHNPVNHEEEDCVAKSSPNNIQGVIINDELRPPKDSKLSLQEVDKGDEERHQQRHQQASSAVVGDLQTLAHNDVDPAITKGFHDEDASSCCRGDDAAAAIVVESGRTKSNDATSDPAAVKDNAINSTTSSGVNNGDEGHAEAEAAEKADDVAAKEGSDNGADNNGNNKEMDHPAAASSLLGQQRSNHTIQIHDAKTISAAASSPSLSNRNHTATPTPTTLSAAAASAIVIVTLTKPNNTNSTTSPHSLGICLEDTNPPIPTSTNTNTNPNLQNTVQISYIKPNYPFHFTDLEAGMTIDTINGHKCPSAEVGAALLKTVPMGGDIRIVARRRRQRGGGHVAGNNNNKSNNSGDACRLTSAGTVAASPGGDGNAIFSGSTTCHVMEKEVVITTQLPTSSASASARMDALGSTPKAAFGLNANDGNDGKVSASKSSCCDKNAEEESAAAMAATTFTVVELSDTEDKKRGAKPLCKAKGCQKYIQQHKCGFCIGHFNVWKKNATRSNTGVGESHEARRVGRAKKKDKQQQNASSDDDNDEEKEDITISQLQKSVSPERRRQRRRRRRKSTSAAMMTNNDDCLDDDEVEFLYSSPPPLKRRTRNSSSSSALLPPTKKAGSSGSTRNKSPHSLSSKKQPIRRSKRESTPPAKLRSFPLISSTIEVDDDDGDSIVQDVVTAVKNNNAGPGQSPNRSPKLLCKFEGCVKFKQSKGNGYCMAHFRSSSSSVTPLPNGGTINDPMKEMDGLKSNRSNRHGKRRPNTNDAEATQEQSHEKKPAKKKKKVPVCKDIIDSPPPSSSSAAAKVSSDTVKRGHNYSVFGEAVVGTSTTASEELCSAHFSNGATAANDVAQSCIQKGSPVVVKDRKLAKGVYMSGGLGRVTNIYSSTDGSNKKEVNRTKYDIAYILGGEDKGVDESYVSPSQVKLVHSLELEGAELEEETTTSGKDNGGGADVSFSELDLLELTPPDAEGIQRRELISDSAHHNHQLSTPLTRTSSSKHNQSHWRCSWCGDLNSTESHPTRCGTCRHHLEGEDPTVSTSSEIALLERTRYELLNGRDFWICTDCAIGVPSLTTPCGNCKRMIRFVPLEIEEFEHFVRKQREQASQEKAQEWQQSQWQQKIKELNEDWSDGEKDENSGRKSSVTLDCYKDIGPHGAFFCSYNGCRSTKQPYCRGFCWEHMLTVFDGIGGRPKTFPLVLPEDRALVTESLHLTLEQMVPCIFGSLERGVVIRREGYPGLACKHCMGKTDVAVAGQWYPSSESAMYGSTFAKGLIRHLQNCPHCPLSVKGVLTQNQTNAKSKEKVLDTITKKGARKPGDRKKFFHRLWCRVHRLPLVDEAVEA